MYFFLKPEFQGRGLGTRALNGISDFLKNNYHCERINVKWLPYAMKFPDPRSRATRFFTVKNGFVRGSGVLGVHDHLTLKL
jgi:RimJ/RimL family protein N-acetyltransferase